MDNLKMDTPDNYFDVVTARHTIINPVQIYKTLKDNGQLILRGVDKLDCWALKRLFGRGQAYHDLKPISLIDYEAVMDAGFKDVPVISFNFAGLEKMPGFKITIPLAERLLKMVVYGDLLQKMTYKNRAYEIKKGDSRYLYFAYPCDTYHIL